ncbi:MAG TPA: hypothetical protein VNQ99_06360 [Xanthobacteraceae bacterium]|nr:hypothetical protein [Xanthobacteraceae bacterium]
MRIAWILAVGFGLLGPAIAATALADHAPALVMPGRSDVPVFIDGQYASYGVVEGDWGLHRPGHGVRTVISPVLMPAPYRGGYYPRTGRRPGYGRREILPAQGRRLPRPAGEYYREWRSPPPSVPEFEGPPLMRRY